MRYLYPALILFLITCFSVNSFAQEPVVEGELIIHLDHDITISELEDQFAHYSLEGVRKLSPGMNIWLAGFNQYLAAGRVLRDIQEHNHVVAAQFNHKVSLRNTPNDPNFNQMWGMNNTGQGGGTIDADIDATEAWDTATGGLTAFGDTIVVAVIDGGFDLFHVDLKYFVNHNEVPNNGIDDDNNGYIDDINGWNAYDNNGFVSSFGSHGTHVSGTVGATGNNSIGVTGVNWGVKILPISGSSGLESTVVAAYAYVLEMRKLYNQTNGASGAYIVATNSSFGVDNANPANYPIWCAMYDSMGKYGVISAAATMNNNSDVDLTGDVPTACASNFLLSVTNTTRSDNKNNSAAYGATTIDIGAPGTDIISTNPGNSYGNSTGTSMASPHVAGAVGLLYSGACEGFMNYANSMPDSGALIMIDYLLNGVDVIPDLATTTTSGGRLNVGNSMALLQQYNCETCTYNLGYNKSDITCYGDDNGVIDLIFSNVSGNLNFLWSDGSTNEDQIGLSPGTYTVTVSDTAGCVRVETITIKEPLDIMITSVVANPVNGSVSGSISILAEGGASELTYSIDGTNFQSLGFFDNLAAGTYTIYAADSNNCMKDTTISLFDVTGIEGLPDPENLKLFPSPAQTDLNVSFYSSENQAYRFSIINILGQAIHSETYRSQAFTENLHVIDISSLASGAYYLSVFDENGAVLTKKFLVD